MELNNLTPLVQKRKRIGRGGCRGGTAGKGGKGQTARSGGKIPARFEGGQMPLVRRLPKRGFSNAQFKTTYDIINLARLADLFEEGSEITRELFIEKGLIKKSAGLVKILAHGEFAKKLVIHADAFSKTAEEAIKSFGGEVRLIKER